MTLLAIECSAGPASAAVMRDGKIIASGFVNIKTTHSQTLMPMIESILSCANLSIDDIDAVAVGVGPGSFTGIRIGISAVKGIAAPKNLPCIAVSTLEGMAQPFSQTDCTVCAVMDARCNQVYNALFNIKGGEITRLCPDRAIMCDELKAELEKTDGEVLICGDGAELFYPYVAELFYPYVKDKENIKKANAINVYQSANGIAVAAEKKYISGYTVSADELLPVYLRLPQAERELKAKLTESKSVTLDK